MGAQNINLFYPQLFKDEWLEILSKVFSTRWLGQGPLVDEFEKQFGEKFGYPYCLALNSGSASLELAYHLIGIKEGDEVLAPVFTCTATNIPLARRKVNLKFLDINNHLLVDYYDVAKKISKKTKAIVVVNLGGMRIDERIFEIAKGYKVPVVIDACQSLGITEPQGDYVCYSFQAIKHFTTGDGGMLIVRNKEEYDRAKKVRWFGIDREAKKRADWKHLVNHQMAMQIEELGYKFHMNDIAAAMGMVGLKHSDELLAYRKSICDIYEKGLTGFYPRIYGGSLWLFAILADKRNDLIDYLTIAGIGCDLIQIRNDVFKVFGGKRQNLPNMNRLEDKYLYIPLHTAMTLKNAEFVAERIRTWNK